MCKVKINTNGWLSITMQNAFLKIFLSAFCLFLSQKEKSSKRQKVVTDTVAQFSFTKPGLHEKKFMKNKIIK